MSEIREPRHTSRTVTGTTTLRSGGFTALLCLSLSGCMAEGGDAVRPVEARAQIRACDDAEVSGTAVFLERPSEEGIKLVDVSIEIRGLKDGRHAVHVHEVGACEPCSAAGGHHDPGPAGMSAPDAPDFNHPFHGGDLLNLEVTDGTGRLTTTTNRFTLSPGRLSVFDEDGSALVIHSAEDTYCDQENELTPGCAGGARDACGILVPVGG